MMLDVALLVGCVVLVVLANLIVASSVEWDRIHLPTYRRKDRGDGQGD